MFSNDKIRNPAENDGIDAARNRHLLIAAVCEWIFTLMIIIHMATFVPDFMSISLNKITVSYDACNVGRKQQVTTLT